MTQEKMKTLSLVCPSCGAGMELSADGESAVCPYCGHKMLIKKEELAQKEYERRMASARAEEDIKDLQRNRQRRRRFKGWLIAVGVFLVIGLVSCNPGVYMAVCQEHGDKHDIPGFGIMNLVPVPAIPVILFGFAAGAGVDYMSLVTTIIPFFLGMLFGNIDHSFTAMANGATPVFLFFMGVTCGSTMNWFTLFSQLGGGILLSVLYFVISLPLTLLVDRAILKRPGYAGASMCSMSAVSIIMPAAVAEVVPSYAPYAETAAAQIALAVAITCIITPFVCQWVLKKWGGAK